MGAVAEEKTLSSLSQNGQKTKGSIKREILPELRKVGYRGTNYQPKAKLFLEQLTDRIEELRDILEYEADNVFIDVQPEDDDFQT
jgi:hypothetical protein